MLEYSGFTKSHKSRNVVSTPDGSITRSTGGWVKLVVDLSQYELIIVFRTRISNSSSGKGGDDTYAAR